MAAVPLTKHNLPLLDFTYLYDDTQPDFTEFMTGRIFTEEQVFADIDSPENWAYRDGEYRTIERTEERPPKWRNYSPGVSPGERSKDNWLSLDRLFRSASERTMHRRSLGWPYFRNWSPAAIVWKWRRT